MNAWSGTNENIQDQQYDSYQNSGNMGRNKKSQTLLNIDLMIASNSRQ